MSVNKENVFIEVSVGGCRGNLVSRILEFISKCDRKMLDQLLKRIFMCSEIPERNKISISITTVGDDTVKILITVYALGTVTKVVRRIEIYLVSTYRRRILFGRVDNDLGRAQEERNKSSSKMFGPDGKRKYPNVEDEESCAGRLEGDDDIDANDMDFSDPSRLDYSEIPAKTPVSVLQEILSRRGTSPKYELVQIEGAIHEPTFRYRVTVGDTVAIGTGRSKKEAKHAAAKNVLDRLIGHPVNEEECYVPTKYESSQVCNSHDKISGNPIGTLQEMCISNKWPPPLYEMTHEEGLPHERQFTITCVVYRYKEVGCGKSKKLAKRQAAYKMWERLQNAPLEQNCIMLNGEEAHNTGFGAERYADLKNTKIPVLTTPHSHRVSSFHRNLRQSTGEKLNQLQTTKLNSGRINFVELLQEIASEQHFEVTYVDIEERSVSGQYQCLVQLSTLPVAVCYGTGVNPNEAQASAAHNALEYLKIMTKG